MSARVRRLAITGFAALTIASAGLPALATTTSAAQATPVGGPVPTGFRVADLSFVSAHRGWALGTAPCTHKPCTSVLRTTDGGKSWVGIPAPIASLTNCTHACVSGLRFANSQVGYAFRSSLEMTTDGGQTWLRQSGDAIGLAINHGLVIRAVADHPDGCPPGCTFRLKGSALGSTTWHGLAAPHVIADGVDIESAGRTVVATYSQNPAGGAPTAHATMLLSNDHGRSWQRRGDPCGRQIAGEDDTVSVGVSAHSHVVVLCRPRRGDRGHDFVRTSSNGGRSFGAVHEITATGGRHAAYLVARTRHAIYVATGQPAGGSVFHYNVDVSRDGGQVWTRTLRIDGSPLGATEGSVLGFQTASTGHFVGPRRTVSRTSDGGRSWKTIHFPT